MCTLMPRNSSISMCNSLIIIMFVFFALQNERTRLSGGQHVIGKNYARVQLSGLRHPNACVATPLVHLSFVSSAKHKRFIYF